VLENDSSWISREIRLRGPERRNVMIRKENFMTLEVLLFDDPEREFLFTSGGMILFTSFIEIVR
jgi:hypothetical protein